MNHHKPVVTIVAAVASLALTACGASNASSINTAEAPAQSVTTTAATPTPTIASTTSQAPQPAPTTAATQAVATIDLANAKFTDAYGQPAEGAAMAASLPYRFDVPATFGWVGAWGYDNPGFLFELSPTSGSSADTDEIRICVNECMFEDEIGFFDGDISQVTPPTTASISYALGPVAKLTMDLSQTPEMYEAEFLFKDTQQNLVSVSVESLSQQTAETVLSQIIVTGK